jgi:hypothetical protein
MSLEQLVHGSAGILHQVEAIGNLDRTWCPGSGSFGIGFRPIAHDDLHSGMLAEPLGQGLCVAPRQQVDRLTCFQIDQNRPVALSPTQGQIINTKDAWCLDLVAIVSAQQAEERIRADEQTSTVGQACSGFASHHPGQLEEEGVGIGRTLRPPGQPRSEVLSKGASHTLRIRTAKAANAQNQPNRAATPGQIGGMAVVPIVDFVRDGAAAGTASGSGCPFCFQDDGRAVENNATNGEG